MLQLLFLLLKDIDDSSLNDVLSKNELYSKLDPSDISNLPKINLDNFVNICKFVDYYQLIDDSEFIANIQYHIFCQTKDVIDNMHLIPLNIQQKVNQNPCLAEMKCHKNNIKHVACYKFLNNSSYSIDRAISHGNLEVVKYLFKIGQDCGPHAIDEASQNGHLDVIKYLFEDKHKDCTDEAIDQASLFGRLEVVKYLFEVQHKNCTTAAIDNASYFCDLKMIKYLFEVAHKDCTIITINSACSLGHPDLIKYLIEVQHKKYTQETINLAKNKKIVDYLKSYPDLFIE